MTLHVDRITRADAVPWMLEKHYAHLVPAVCTDYFGLFDGRILVGVCVYGPPTNRSSQGVCGESHSFELLRLSVGSDKRNAASMLVGRSLAMLPVTAYVVSYADASIGHVGYVYQATNWIYTGMGRPGRHYTDKRTGEQMHERTVDHRYAKDGTRKLPKYVVSELDAIGKHRYIKLLGNRREVKAMRKALKYESLPYPKGPTTRHEVADSVPVQVNMFGGDKP